MSETKDAERYDQRMKEQLKKLERLCNTIKATDGEERRTCLAEARALIDQYKRNKKSYKAEIANIKNADYQADFAGRLAKHDANFKNINRELKTLDNDADRDDLLSGAKSPTKLDPRKATNSELLNDAADTESKTATRLREALQTVTQAEELGTQTAAALVEQGQQINRIHGKVIAIDENLNRADKLITAFMRRMYTDRLILVFAGLVLFAVAGIIIYSVVSPGQTTFSVPDAAKPPSPDEIQKQAQKLTGRRLRGFADVD